MLTGSMEISGDPSSAETWLLQMGLRIPSVLHKSLHLPVTSPQQLLKPGRQITGDLTLVGQRPGQRMHQHLKRRQPHQGS